MINLHKVSIKHQMSSLACTVVWATFDLFDTGTIFRPFLRLIVLLQIWHVLLWYWTNWRDSPSRFQGCGRSAVGTQETSKGHPQFFRVLQTFTRVNRSEPKKCYLFLLENTAFKKKEKLFVISIFQNVNILCACSIITLSTRISSEF